MARPAKSVSAPSSGRKIPSQAEIFRRTREAHARELAEDYLEEIAALVEETGEARVTDLARRLGVTHVTVNRTIARLREAGFVESQPYRAIFLTESGRKIAEESKARHEVVVNFLCAVGVPEAVAHRDAEGIEHHVSPETLAAFAKVIASAKKA